MLKPTGQLGLSFPEDIGLAMVTSPVSEFFHWITVNICRYLEMPLESVQILQWAQDIAAGLMT